MAGKIEAHIKSLGLTLPQASAPVANYVPYVRTGNLVFVSGQLPLQDGAVKYTGLVGGDVSADDGYQAAKLCALNLIAQVKAACDGDLDRVKRVVKLTGFVAAGAQFTDQPKVINGASDLMVEVFGDAGRHSRAAVGAPSLPRGAAVEVEAVFEVA
ncbi:MAG: RidA family protein [Rhodospirillaceae bacterium]|nr:RidA family protein [Rhodospirillaceae bacterium]